jgi:hypothetical protein
MIQKMRNEQTCGAQMPTTGIISPTLTQIVEDWIDMGALNN